MDGDYRSQAGRLRHDLIRNCLFGLVLLPAVNLLVWFLRGRADSARRAHSAFDLAVDAAFAVFVLALTLAYERRTLAASRTRGGSFPRDRIAALIGSAGMSGFLAVPGFMAGFRAGWTWAAMFYAVFALFQLRLLLLWRRCEREAVG